MKKILIPVDGSEHSKRALGKGKEMAEAFNSDVVLLNVMSAENSISNLGYPHYEAVVNWPELAKEAEAKAEEILEEGKKAIVDIPGKVETVTLSEPTGNVAKVILEYVENNDFDLVIMGSKGMGSLSTRLYFGSVTTKVLHLVDKPVLVVQ